jgi:pyruvate/2-oxoglutarate dehydrogenase complex dihydrolipoamide acyltransferase (E2) component
MITEVSVPEVGQTVEACQLLEWFGQPGDPVQQGEPLFALETDKAAFDVEAPISGILHEVLVEAGSDVTIGSVVGRIRTTEEEQ